MTFLSRVEAKGIIVDSFIDVRARFLTSDGCLKIISVRDDTLMFSPNQSKE